MPLGVVLLWILFQASPVHCFQYDEINQAVFQIGRGSGTVPSSSWSDTVRPTCISAIPSATSGSLFLSGTAVPVPTGFPTNIDPATPSADSKRTSKQGLTYELVWSEEFLLDGRDFGFNDHHSDCDDPKWERTRPDLLRYWELADLTEEEFDTLQELDSDAPSDGLNYVYLYGDGDIAEAASRAKYCEDGDGEDIVSKFSIAPPPSELAPPEAEDEPPAVILLRPYSTGWSVYAPLNNRGGRELIQTREPICVPLGGFIEVGVVATGIPNIPYSVRRVIFWPGQPPTSLEKYSWKLINDSVSGWDFDSDIVLDFDTGKMPSMELLNVDSPVDQPYQYTDTLVTLGLPTEAGDVDYVRVYAPAYVKGRSHKLLSACGEDATRNHLDEKYIVLDLAHVRGL